MLTSYPARLSKIQYHLFTLRDMEVCADPSSDRFVYESRGQWG